VCGWAVPKTSNADPSASALRWLPAGALWTTTSTLFDIEGRKAPPSTFTVTPSAVNLTQLIPSDASVDVSSGLGIVPLTHPEAVTAVDCGAVHCTLENGGISIPAPPASVTAVDIRIHLIAHALFTRKNPADSQPVLRVSVLRCPMDVVSGPVLRSTESARAVVRLQGGCTRDLGSLRFLVGSRRAEISETVSANDSTYIVLAVGSVDAPSLSFTGIRGEADVTVVAVARVDTRAPPQVRTILEIAGYPKVEFIPTNRTAIVHHPHVEGAELALLPIDGVYSVSMVGGKTLVRGDPDAAGMVALQFGYRVPSLPAPLDKVSLGTLVDPLQRNIKEANIPAPFDISSTSDEPLVELLCTDREGHDVRVQPGKPQHFPYAIRDNCRVILHRERLAPEYGSQKLTLDIDVSKVDGSPRPDAHISQSIVLRPGETPRIAWIKGARDPYDRIVVKLSLVADETHYLGALDIVSGAPAVQWAIILGTGHVRLYATTTIPTGLYRFGDAATSGVLSLSFGVISRLTWVDTNGKDGLLGVEAGVVAFGLTGDPSTSGTTTLTQVGAVTGIGLSIPIAGAGTPGQATIDLHGWFEERIGGSASNAGNPRAFIFGPSISIGNLGGTF